MDTKPTTANPFVFAEELARQGNGDGTFPTATAVTDLLRLSSTDTEFHDAMAEYRRHWRTLRSGGAK